MRYVLACIALVALQSGAHAEKLLTPVQIVKEATYCGTVPGLLYRERLAADKRYESLDEQDTIDVFLPGDHKAKCGTLHRGKYVFFDGVYRDKKTHKVSLVCVRFRPFGDCVWTRPDTIGTVYELFPGRTLNQGNKGVTCAQWAKVIGPPAPPSNKPANLTLSAEDRMDWFVKDMTKGVGNMLFGTRTQAQDNRAYICGNAVQILQHTGLRLTAFNACPSLGTNGQMESARNIYNSQLKYFMDCLPK